MINGCFNKRLTLIMFFILSQMLSRPLLVLSIATAFSDKEEFNDKASDGSSGSLVNPESHSEEPSVRSALDTRYIKQ